ncbi:MAG: hypothetical protein ACOYJW_08020 [Candidatus Omnitrophota bacterium]|jgi:hypothetical protein
MIQYIKNGWYLIKESGRVFGRHPKFLIPMVIVWCIYAPTVLYFKYAFDWNAHPTAQCFLIAFAIIFGFSLLISFACSMLLELIQQLESNRKVSVIKAFFSSIRFNAMQILPVAFAWSVIWFVLALIDALLSKFRGENNQPFNAENSAKTLAGYRDASAVSISIEALKKGVRMVVFLILPGIAWDNLNFFQATKKGLVILRTHLSTFIAGFILTDLAAVIIFIMPAILFFLSDKFNVVFPDWVWFVTMIYIAFGWSYALYLEQLVMANLYLWNYKWEKEVARARREGRSIPTLEQIPCPSVLDEVYELAEKSSIAIDPMR